MEHKCHDCGVLEGALHEPGCDTERCPVCSHQLISCGCNNAYFYVDYVPFRKRDMRTWPRMTQVEHDHAEKCTTPHGSCATCASIFLSGKTAGLPVHVYMRGLSDEQNDEYDRVLAAKGRIPYIVYPNMCARCGVLWPEMFRVSDEEWERYIEPAMRSSMLCKACWKWIKTQIDVASTARASKGLQ